MKVKFNLEGNPDVAFYALYASMKMFSDKKADEKRGTNEVSISGAEAYCLLQDLKEQFPHKFAESEKEYERAKFEEWLLSYPGVTFEKYENLNPELKSELLQVYQNTKKP